MTRPNNATHTIFAIMIIAALWTFGGCFDDANAQAGPVPTPTPTPIIAPRPMNICAHPQWTCVYLSVIRNDEAVMGDVQ